MVTEKAEFDITGMTCAACSTRIEKGLNKLEGVVKANVNLALEKATVEYNGSALTTNDIIKKVENLGYGAHVKEDAKETSDHRQKEIKKANEKVYLFCNSFPSIIVGNVRTLFVYFLHMGTRDIYESMVSVGFGYSRSVYYRRTVLYWCL